MNRCGLIRENYTPASELSRSRYNLKTIGVETYGARNRAVLAPPCCDGQILIAPDILGLTQGPSPKFAKSYGNLADRTIEAFAEYSREIQAGQYPDKEHSYHMKAGELGRLEELLQRG